MLNHAFFLKWCVVHGRLRVDTSSPQAVAKRLVQLFNEADVDGSGELDSAELSMVVRRLEVDLGREVSMCEVDAKVTALMTRFDIDCDGSLTLLEFAELACSGHDGGIALFGEIEPEVRSEVPKYIMQQVQGSGSQQPLEHLAACSMVQRLFRL